MDAITGASGCKSATYFYLSTYAMIDGTEIFLETPSDFQMQLSMWSEYKHHNTSSLMFDWLHP